MKQLNQEGLTSHLTVFQQAILNAIGDSAKPWQLTGDAFDRDEIVPALKRSGDLTALYYFYASELYLCYLFGKFELAVEAAIAAENYLGGATGLFIVPICYTYDSLAHLAIYSHVPKARQQAILERVAKNQQKMRNWADSAPENYLHKFYLVEAERYRVLGHKSEALEFYDRAIAEATENEYCHEVALAYELAAKFYLAWEKPRLAKEYLYNAYYGYARWGAAAKVNDLEQSYPELLALILQQDELPFSAEQTLHGTNTITRSQTITNKSSTSSNRGISAALDLRTVLKAFQTISSEIHLEKLLSTLLQVLIENAGADKCALLLLEENKLIIKAIKTVVSGSIEMISIPLEESEELPITTINTVKRTLQPSVISNATIHPLLVADAYITRQQPKSLLCAPILHQGKLLGILYLENNLATGAFTSDRVEIFNLLCTQAAISLENARLYQQAQTALQESQKARHLLRLVIDNVPQTIFWKDRNSVYLGCNQNFAEMANVGSPKNIVGKTDYDLPWTEEEANSYREYDRRIMESNQAELHIIETLQKDGETRWFDTSKIPLCDARCNVFGILGTTEDITERKLAEAALQQRTIDLENALRELQQAQVQLVQSEKMSALGNLVAGIAHEINNPVGFIAGNIQPAQEYIQDLLNLLDLYQQKLPNTDAEIESEIAAIELDYLREDLPKLIDSMNLGIDRICSISTSLRTFSRADKDYKVLFNIHEGIDSTILILKHRFKGNDERPSIEVIKNYGELSPIKCFPGQLNQVFMNILANAIDALESSNEGRSFGEIKKCPNRITITTEMKEREWVKIQIADNGIGMTEEVKQRIFDHLFTTKGVGKGTGLGLAIAHQIVVEKHGGTMNVNSVPGRGTEFTIELPIKE